MNSTLKFLNDQSGILTLSSIGAAIIFFIVEQYFEKRNKKQEFNDRLRRICNTLLIDINAVNEYYQGEIYKALKVKRYAADYSQNIINTASYQGVLNSGLTTYFQTDTQRELNTYYFYITMHNKRMFYMAEMANNRLNSSDLTLEDQNKLENSLSWILNENELTKYENEIIKAVPVVKQKLNDELARLEK